MYATVREMTGSVAVIGAGPGGLVAARWLLSQGFEPTIFEQSPDARRAVDRAGRHQRRLADHAHQHQPDPHVLQRPGTRQRPDIPVEPRHPRLPAPLCRDVRADVTHPIRHPSRPSEPRRRRLARRAFRYDGGLRTSGGGQRSGSNHPACQRFPDSRHSPARPERCPHTNIANHFPTSASAFSSRAAPSARSKSPPNWLNSARPSWSPSAASAMSCRSSPRVCPPTLGSSRGTERWRTRLSPPTEIDRQLKEIVVEAGGSPEQYGAPAPDPSLFAAGVTLAQQYLPLVAEGRITVRPWMTSVDGRR